MIYRNDTVSRVDGNELVETRLKDLKGSRILQRIGTRKKRQFLFLLGWNLKYIYDISSLIAVSNIELCNTAYTWNNTECNALERTHFSMKLKIHLNKLDLQRLIYQKSKIFNIFRCNLFKNNYENTNFPFEIPIFESTFILFHNHYLFDLK